MAPSDLMPPDISSPIDQFVHERGGDFPIKTVLIASNGLAAVKGIRSMRKWCFEEFGDENAIKFISMATRNDIDANAEFIKLANHYVEVPGGPNNYNYANVDLIVNLARLYRVQVLLLIFIIYLLNIFFMKGRLGWMGACF